MKVSERRFCEKFALELVESLRDGKLTPGTEEVYFGGGKLACEIEK